MMPIWAFLAVVAFGLAWLTLDIIGMVRAYRKQNYGLLAVLLIATLVILGGAGFMLASPGRSTVVAMVVGFAVVVDMLGLLWLELNMGKTISKTPEQYH